MDCTTIDDDRKRYDPGLKDSSDKELTLYLYDDSDQAALLAAVAAHETVMIKHQWTNGKIASYSLKLLGYQIVSGTADGFMQLKITGKQESDVTWSTATTVSG